MRKLLVVFIVVAALSIGVAVPASAHVHGITPLNCTPAVLHTDNTGANATDNTPAAAANGGPIAGLIPRDTGNSPLDIGDGGRNAAVCQP